MAEVIFHKPFPSSPIDCKRRMSGLIIKTDLPMSSFPEYKDPFFESSGDTMSIAVDFIQGRVVDVSRLGRRMPARFPPDLVHELLSGIHCYWRVHYCVA